MKSCPAAVARFRVTGVAVTDGGFGQAQAPVPAGGRSPRRGPPHEAHRGQREDARGAARSSPRRRESTITIKGDKENRPSVDAAAGALKTVKAGDKVTVTCWDNAKGEHEKVIAIVPAKVAAPAKQ